MTGVVHHIILYACYHDVPSELDGYGQFCASASMPEVVGQCISPLVAWAVGGQVSILTVWYTDHRGWGWRLWGDESAVQNAELLFIKIYNMQNFVRNETEKIIQNIYMYSFFFEVIL